MLALFVLAGLMVVAGIGVALFARPHRADRKFRQTMLNGFAIALLGVVLLAIDIVRVAR